MSRLITAALVVIALYLGFAGTAIAASTTVAVVDAPGDGSIFDLAKPVFDAVRSGNGWLAAALALVLLVAGARRYGAKRFPWLTSKSGGAAANVLLSFGGMLATAFAAGSAPTWALALTSLKVSIVAAGGFTLIKELAVPALRWIESKAPAFARPYIGPLFNVLCNLFEGRGTAAIAKAEAAGKAAVTAKPAPGLAGVVGKTDELR